MTEQRYPVDLVVTAQDFAECGWGEILEQTSREGYPTMYQEFSTAARKAIEDGHSKHGKVLWLLADACSMMLSPSSPNEPFKPFVVMNGRRSSIPDDLSAPDLSFFAQIIDVADDPWLKARLADLVWLKQTPGDVKFALVAIDAYRVIPLNTEIWTLGGRECWERAISLARMLRTGADNRLEEMEISIVKSFDSATKDDGYLGLWLADLLKTNGLGRGCTATVAKKLKLLARNFDAEGDLRGSREYFSASADWYKTAGDNVRVTEMTIAHAEGWVKETIAKISLDTPSHMGAASFYEKAIQIYRTIPNAERVAYRVNERIAELRAHMSESGEKSLDEMKVISTPGIDITQLVENARKSVSGKPITEALLSFANLYRGARVDELRKNALDRMRQFPLQSFCGATMVSHGGRVISKCPPMSFGAELSADDEIAIRAKMIDEYRILIGTVVQGNIRPAHEILLLEHRLREADFVDLANRSPIVPIGRAGLFGKALFKGFDRDFVSALHLLIPQIEHMVRVHLKQAGAKTTNLDRDGIENENGLSTLMDLPAMEAQFGKDLAFELKTLLCDPCGSNLRNGLAHGLLDEDACLSQFSIYAWWLVLRLVIVNHLMPASWRA